ncbi:helix-turn-helix domain-containing protein [Glaciecola sp. SC05]|uniref:helix-turn-helix domain-containing protein n=1 Tax=Glaciecola sp. SC05 TaxID=1987355 RepID=UPI003526D588
MATVTGLSHRTIQRIENSGNASLESKRALSAALEMDIDELEFVHPNTINKNKLVKVKRFTVNIASILFIPLVVFVTVFFIRNVQNTANFEIVIANPNDISSKIYSLKFKQDKASIIQVRNGYSLEVELLSGFTPRLKAQLFYTDSSGKRLLHTSNRLGTYFYPVKYVIRQGNEVCYESPISDTGDGCAGT